MSDNIITITDFMDPNLDVYARLTENQLLNRANPKAVSYTHLLWQIILSPTDVKHLGLKR